MNFPFWRVGKTSDLFDHERVVGLVKQSANETSIDAYIAVLEELIELYHELAEVDETAAQEARQAFVLSLRSHPSITGSEKFIRFLLDHIQPEDYAQIPWDAPNQIIRCCEAMYSLPFESQEVADLVAKHVLHLLRHALHRFEQKGDYEKMFRLLQIAPLPEALSDPELLRLRNRAYLYEMRRVRRGRRILYGYLILQVFLVVLVFPLVFINAENGAIQRQIEETTNVELTEGSSVQYLSYNHGLYWAIITAASIGYGDITPVTDMGKFIAGVLGTMGVITVGVIAGLILSWITPRVLD